MAPECLHDAALDRLMVLDSPVNFNKADIGRCDASRLFPNLTDTFPGVDPTVPSFTVTVTIPSSTTVSTPEAVVGPTTPAGPTVVCHPIVSLSSLSLKFKLLFKHLISDKLYLPEGIIITKSVFLPICS